MSVRIMVKSLPNEISDACNEESSKIISIVRTGGLVFATVKKIEDSEEKPEKLFVFQGEVSHINAQLEIYKIENVEAAIIDNGFSFVFVRMSLDHKNKIDKELKRQQTVAENARKKEEKAKKKAELEASIKAAKEKIAEL